MTFKQGDIVWVNFNPQKGHEQNGKRPAIILWNNFMQERMGGLSLVAPITTTDNGFPLHIKLETAKQKITGFIMCEHIRLLDLTSRDAELIDTATKNVIEDTVDIISSCIEIN